MACPLTSRSLQITLSRPGDAHRIATLSRDTIEHGLTWSWTPQRVVRCIAAPDINVISAHQDNELVGFGIMFYGSRAAHLNLLAVDPLSRNRGVGHCLLNWLEDCAITAGLDRCQLELRESNKVAKRFYHAHGYAETERIQGYYQQRENAIRMTHSLRVGDVQT